MTSAPLLEPALVALNASAAFNRWAGFEIVLARPGEVELGLDWHDNLGQYAGSFTPA